MRLYLITLVVLSLTSGCLSKTAAKAIAPGAQSARVALSMGERIEKVVDILKVEFDFKPYMGDEVESECDVVEVSDSLLDRRREELLDLPDGKLEQIWKSVVVAKKG